jgi:hypothetical protein
LIVYWSYDKSHVPGARQVLASGEESLQGDGAAIPVTLNTAGTLTRVRLVHPRA